MQNNKIDAFLTVEKISQMIEWLYENENEVEIEPSVKKRIAYILEGKIDPMPLPCAYGVLIKDEHGVYFDMTKHYLEGLLDFYEKVKPYVEHSIRQPYKKTLKEAHRNLSMMFKKEKKNPNIKLEYLKQRRIMLAFCHKRTNLTSELFISEMVEEAVIRLFPKSIDKKDLEKYENDWFEKVNMVNSEIELFCSVNRVAIQIRELFFNIAHVHLYFGLLLITFLKGQIVASTEYKSIVDYYGDFLKEEKKIKPKEGEFYRYMIDNNDNIGNLFDANNLKRYLAQFVNFEVLKMRNFLQETKPSDQVEESEPNIILQKTGEKFSLPQIALIYYYDGLPLNGNNRDREVLKYGWHSGKKLHEWYDKFNTGTSIRLYSPSSGKKIYSVLEYLTTETGKTKAKKDLKDIRFDFE